MISLSLSFQYFNSVKLDLGPLCTWVGVFSETLDKCWRKFLKARDGTVYKFRRKYFACPWEFWRTK